MNAFGWGPVRGVDRVFGMGGGRMKGSDEFGIPSYRFASHAID